MSAREILAKTLADINTETMPCPRCNGYGYHYGFGEHGHDPDWCDQCQGPGFVMAHDAAKTPDILVAALRAAGYEIVPLHPTLEMVHNGQRWREDGAPVSDIWSAMLAASSPRPPIGEQ